MGAYDYEAKNGGGISYQKFQYQESLKVYPK